MSERFFPPENEGETIMRRTCRRAAPASACLGLALILALPAFVGAEVALAAPGAVEGRAAAAGPGAREISAPDVPPEPSSSAAGVDVPVAAPAEGTPLPPAGADSAAGSVPGWPHRPPPRHPWVGFGPSADQTSYVVERNAVPKRPVPRVPGGLFVTAVGLRSTRVSSTSYQPFSENKAFAEVEIDAGVRVFRDETKAFYLGLAGGWGMTEAPARGATAHLEAARAELLAQGAYAFRSFLMAIGRVSAGALWRDARLVGEAVGNLEQKVWLPQGAAYLGLAARVPASRVDLLFSVEGGYAFVPNRRLRLGPETTSLRESTTPVDLGDLSLGGPGVALRAALLF
jgi:hypothetical protein